MFSVIFPGQGSQLVGMGKEFYDKFDLVKNLFKEADESLNFSLSKLILEGPKDELDLTTNTQPAIFLISYSIFNVVKTEFNIDLTKAKYFAGHSLGEYSALSCAGYLSFSETFNNERIADAYEKLLLEVMLGNQALFVRRDEVEEAWSWVDSIINAWQGSREAPHSYQAGTWGPVASIAQLARDEHAWYEITSGA